ncbi:DNA modification methylase [Stella humosa]|uniref:Methyltransferase n=1 Tax=Stella humosa TaxID=94 RepID=A0A3N1KWU3_9PROT|nr:DNA methyltransferase [Stella humosa]ROP83942.1 DNA modification methylase [Stella humosa]BBK33449.1 methyltransferase [Stella humosa]
MAKQTRPKIDRPSARVDRPSFAAFSGTIVQQPLARLTASRNNPRTHSDHQIAQLAASIEQFGFLAPILVDEAGRILAGHARTEAARRLGLRQVPTLRIDHLDEAQKRAYVIADNRLAELAGWDRDLLRLEFQDLLEIGFPVEITGYATVDIDQLVLETVSPAAKPDPDDVAPTASGPAVSRLGDLWQLGRHQLLCGNALDPVAYATLLGTTAAQMVFTDPPYNVPIRGHVSGTGRHREFAMASGEMGNAEFATFLASVCGLLARNSQDGAILYLCMDWRHLAELLTGVLSAGLELKNLCVWAKTNAGMGSFYRSQHELVVVAKNGQAPHINNFGLGEKGRYRTNLWTYPGVNSMRGEAAEDAAIHPTVKPVALVADAIRDCSRHDGVVLDPFCGSGTILMAAERTHRVARAMELDPLYVDAAIRRWQRRTGGIARHAGSGETFEAIEAARVAVHDHTEADQ